MMNRNEYKKETYEDRFARRYYCKRARLNSVREGKRRQHKEFRQLNKKLCTEYIGDESDV